MKVYGGFNLVLEYKFTYIYLLFQEGFYIFNSILRY